MQEKIADEGGIEAVLAAMTAHKQDATVQESGCWALWQIAMNRNAKLRSVFSPEPYPRTVLSAR